MKLTKSAPKSVRRKETRIDLEPLASGDPKTVPDGFARISTSKSGSKQATEVKLFAGGLETTSIETLERPSAQLGLFTSRGPTMKVHGVAYADYNEDAAVMTVAHGSAGEVFFAGAFDQAGGMGHIPGQTGAASRIAAEHLAPVAEQVANGTAAKAALQKAVEKAHAAIREINEAHGVEAITTVAAGLVLGDSAFVANTGDSQVYHFDANGVLKNMSEPHNLGDEMARDTGNPNAGVEYAHIVTSALGIEGEAPKLDLYEWKLAPGDYLICTSDGISDAHQLAQYAASKTKTKKWTLSGGDQVAIDLGEILKSSPSAEQATKAIRDYALSQMKKELGKPDNTTVVVLRKA